MSQSLLWILGTFYVTPRTLLLFLYLQNLRLLLGASILFFLVLSCVQVVFPFSLSDAGWLFEPSVHPCLVSFCMAFTSDCEFPCPFTVGNRLDRWGVSLHCYVCVVHVCTHVCRCAHQCNCNVEARSWCWNAFLDCFYALFFFFRQYILWSL